MLLSSLPVALQLMLYGLFQTPEAVPQLDFHLRHSHSTALNDSSRLIFSDVAPHLAEATEAFTIRTRNVRAHKPPSLALYTAARWGTQSLAWEEDHVAAPDVERRETLRQLAKMTSNAYYEPNNTAWYDLGPDWNTTFSHGWEPDADGFRGHVFVSTDEKTVVLSIKGTSVPGWIPGAGGGGPTTSKDKLNDNLLFSCCCARVGPTWSPVCGCYEGGDKCNQDCVERSLAEESLFYPVGINLYNNVTFMYPNANIWVIGHSLGGSLANLVGATFGAPTVAFEAPGDRMASRRLHLPMPPSLDHIVNVYHTADPIPQGQCTGVASTCATAGYALEAQCHLGKIIRYDTVGKLGWHSTIPNHSINVVVDSLLDVDWDPENGREVPELQDESEDCIDCFRWEFV